MFCCKRSLFFTFVFFPFSFFFSCFLFAFCFPSVGGAPTPITYSGVLPSQSDSTYRHYTVNILEYQVMPCLYWLTHSSRTRGSIDLSTLELAFSTVAHNISGGISSPMPMLNPSCKGHHIPIWVSSIYPQHTKKCAYSVLLSKTLRTGTELVIRINGKR